MNCNSLRMMRAGTQISRFCAVAALMVVFEHALADVARATETHVHAIWLSGFGVTIFFVISGFIIHHSSRKMFSSQSDWKSFLWRRLWRIAPLYWAATLLYVIMILTFSESVNKGGIPLHHLAGSLLFIPVYGISPVYSLGWSLNFEMLFYVSFAITLVLPQRWAIIALFAWFASLMILHPLTSRGTIAHVWTAYHIAGFLTGVLVSLAAARWQRRYEPMWFRLSAAALLAVAATVFAGIEHYEIGVTPIALATALVAAAAFTKSADIASIGKTIGDASYSLYLLHMFVIRALAIMLPPLPAFVLLCLICVLSCLVAIASYHLFERTVLNFSERLWRRSGHLVGLSTEKNTQSRLRQESASNSIEIAQIGNKT